MKRKYIFHPGSYAVGENEKLYAEMASKGWLLEKRGSYLSRFRRAEPSCLRYRIELASPHTGIGETELPDEQLELYKECGWSYVTGNVFIHVFSAPEDSGAPEIYTDPRQQAATLKGLRRRYFSSWIPLALTLPFNLFLRLLIPVRSGSIMSRFTSVVGFGWVTYTAIILLYAFAVLWAVYYALYGSIRLSRLYRQLKHGRQIDHAPQMPRRFHRTVSIVLAACCIVLAALSIVQLAQHKKYEMPLKADGPYLLLKDMGWDGARTHMFTDDTPSYVETDRSMLADQWHTYECVAAGNGNCWMYQNVYVLQDKKLADLIIQYIMMNAVFTPDVSAFTRVDVTGLDAAYVGNMEYIALKGKTVYYISSFEPGGNTDQKTQAAVFRALADIDSTT